MGLFFTYMVLKIFISTQCGTSLPLKCDFLPYWVEMGKLSTIKVKERSENLSQGFGLRCGVKVDGSTWLLVRISKTELAMDP